MLNPISNRLSNKLLFFLFFVFTISFYSCKKESSFRDQLVGTWYDGGHDYIIFNSDGSGKIRVLGYPDELMNWTVMANNTELLISYVGSGSEVWHIITLNSTSFDFIQGANNTNIVDCTRN